MSTSTIKAGAAYFGLVFAAGFALGTVRTLWLVSALGERNAELVETPFMVLISFLAARFVIGKMGEVGVQRRIAVGGFALLLLIGAELSVVLFVREQTLGEYSSSRDPLAGAVYLCALALFGAAPVLVGPRRR
jgi:hypothetical protein